MANPSPNGASTSSTAVESNCGSSRRNCRRVAPEFPVLLPEGARERLGVNLQIKLEDVLAYAERHKKLELGFRAAYELRDLPKYDDVSMYGAGKNLEKSLVRIEARRLIAAVNAKEPLLFDSSGILENATKEGFQSVANISDQLGCDDRTGPENLRHRLPEKLAENNRELYFLVVNYVTAVIMRYLAACAASEQWLIITLSVLAKQSMKLEVLEKDPPAYAKMSQEAEEDLNDEQEQHRYLSILEKPSSLISDTDKFLEMDQIYHFEEWYIRDTINWLFLYMLSAIGGSSPTTDGGSCFEMSTRVYRTGMSSSPLVISSDWDGEYSASSDAQRIRYCRSALDILLLNTREIAKHKSHTSRLVQIQWDFEGSRDPEYRPVELQHQACTQRQFSISSMDDALSMIMPLALCNAHAAIEAFCMITTTNISCVSTGKPRSREYIDEHFLAKFSFTTSAYNKAQQKIGTSPGYKSLQKANSREERLVPSCSLESTNERDCDWPTFKKQMDTTSEWKLDETCVIVECGPYVWTIMGIALFIVIGGLAVPFSSHVRLEGVDPFNITTFVWLLVAFFVLIAKSRYVPNWAWHDFLHRRIICRTVTELANVTAMDPQLVIHKLLVSENSSVLGTRGPHNSMFKLQRPNGFSIDVPVKTPTLYTNGFVLFRCLGKVDQHIVCLDARPIDLTSTSLLVAEHRPTQKSFGCRLPAPSQPVPSNGMKLYMDVLKLTEREYEGDRILGLFLAGAEFG